MGNSNMLKFFYYIRRLRNASCDLEEAVSNHDRLMKRKHVVSRLNGEKKKDFSEFRRF